MTCAGWARTSSDRAPAALWWIVGFKVLKAGSLVALGAALLVTRHMPPETLLVQAALALHLPLSSGLAQRALDAAASLTPAREVLLGLAALAYAGLFATEAVGLARRAAWARWLTVTATSCLIPLEAYEIARRPTLVRTLVLLINLAVVAYLVRRKDVFER
jgi:uncharacterized membrane protein (DUF2068 family)